MNISYIFISCVCDFKIVNIYIFNMQLSRCCNSVSTVVNNTINISGARQCACTMRAPARKCPRLASLVPSTCSGVQTSPSARPENRLAGIIPPLAVSRQDLKNVLFSSA